MCYVVVDVFGVVAADRTVYPFVVFGQVLADAVEELLEGLQMIGNPFSQGILCDLPAEGGLLLIKLVDLVHRRDQPVVQSLRPALISIHLLDVTPVLHVVHLFHIRVQFFYEFLISNCKKK